MGLFRLKMKKKLPRPQNSAKTKFLGTLIGGHISLADGILKEGGYVRITTKTSYVDVTACLEAKSKRDEPDPEAVNQGLVALAALDI
jgi:hypothetical protein